MNDFTKEELVDIRDCIDYYNMNCHPKSREDVLRVKVQSMIHKFCILESEKLNKTSMPIMKEMCE